MRWFLLSQLRVSHTIVCLPWSSHSVAVAPSCSEAPGPPILCRIPFRVGPKTGKGLGSHSKQSVVRSTETRWNYSVSCYVVCGCPPFRFLASFPDQHVWTFLGLSSERIKGVCLLFGEWNGGWNDGEEKGRNGSVPSLLYRCSTRKGTTPSVLQSTFFLGWRVTGLKSSYRHRFHRSPRHQRTDQAQDNLWPLGGVQ